MAGCSTKTRPLATSRCEAAQQLVEKHAEVSKTDLAREAERRVALDSSALSRAVATLLGAANLTMGSKGTVQALTDAFEALAKGFATAVESVNSFPGFCTGGFEQRLIELVDVRSDFSKIVTRILGAARWCCIARESCFAAGVFDEANDRLQCAATVSAALAASEPVLDRLKKDIIAALERLHGVLEGGDPALNSTVAGEARSMVAAVAFADAVGALAGATEFDGVVKTAARLQESAVIVADGELTQGKEETACLDRFLALASARRESAATAVAESDIYGDPNEISEVGNVFIDDSSIYDDPHLASQGPVPSKRPHVPQGNTQSTAKSSNALPSEADGRRAFNHMSWLQGALESFKMWRAEASDGDLQRVFCDEPVKMFGALRETLEKVRCATLADLDDKDGVAVTQDEVGCSLQLCE